MLEPVKLLGLLESGNASLLLVKGQHPDGEFPRYMST